MKKELIGQKNVGKFGSIPMSIDWAYIRDGGIRSIENRFQVYAGRFFLFVSIVLIGLSLFLNISTGEISFINLKEETGADFIGWLGLGIGMAAMFLIRDRSEFSDKVSHTGLQSLKKRIDKKKIESIELTNYLNYSLTDILDLVIARNPVDYVETLFRELLKSKAVVAALPRTGKNAKELLQLDFTRVDETLSDFGSFMEKMIVGSFDISMRYEFKYVDEISVFAYLSKTYLKDLLLEKEILEDEIDGMLLWIGNQEKKKHYRELWKVKAPLKPTSIVNRSYTSGFAGTLNQFSRDFTLEVLKGEFEVSLAREKELDQLTQTISQGDKNSVLLVGESGVGKTSIIKNLAVRMVTEDVPKQLQDMRLVGFDVSKASATSKNIDSFKTKIQKIFEETAKAKNIILVLEDIVQLLGVREDLAGEIIGIMIDSIDKYNLRLIVTATSETYKKHIKPNTSLIKFFSVLEIAEPNDIATTQILIDLAGKLEQRYKTKITYDAIKETVSLSHKVLHDKVLPQKAVELLEEAISYSARTRDDLVTMEDIQKLISSKVGVNVGKITSGEGEFLSKIEDEIHKRVIGQDSAISGVSNALRRSRAGLSGTSRPVASFLFFGPTGVGKTETAKALAHVYYGSEKRMIRLDMSEFQESENLKRLIGYSNGREFEGGFLTEPIRENSFSLVLLDEIEKANPKVLDIFLQILDEGSITDGVGRKVDFTNSIIIATSNASSKFIAEELSKNKSYDEVYSAVLPKLRDTFRVEFLNRFDQIIMYRPLMHEEIAKVAGLMMDKEVQKLKNQGIELAYSDALLGELATAGYNQVYGARELQRVIQDRVENPLARMIVEGKLKSGSKIRINNLKEL